MSKKVFFVLVILMSLSLIGIIFVQAYYIKNSISTKEDQFTFNVKKALNYVADNIEDEDFKDHALKLKREIESR
ncbi:hypothetical protein [Lacinutrix neustonica]|uniref:hypothetical protein n=1 Tax=Lacinutrix neustonica TaxID=2980107 RepID=UPI0028BEF223|nr:hypothetical protein [Lacinutrix neustonica]